MLIDKKSRGLYRSIKKFLTLFRITEQKRFNQIIMYQKYSKFKQIDIKKFTHARSLAQATKK